MKNLILVFLLIFISNAIYAQKPRIEQLKDQRIETYAFKKGKGDSVRYVIQGQKDTIQTTLFKRSGKPTLITWKDSTFYFDFFGQLRTKIFGIADASEISDSTITFHPNGLPLQIHTYKNGVKKRWIFSEKGQLQLKEYGDKTPSVTWERIEFGDGTIKKSKRTDSLLVENKRFVRVYDTAFYENGQPYSITHSQGFGRYANEYVMTKFFYKNGALMESILPDSLILTPFKDNVDCYYGLKNNKGDTIISPRFDHVEVSKYDNLIRAYNGEVCTLYTLEGVRMKQPTKNLRNINAIGAMAKSQTYDQMVLAGYSKTFIETTAQIKSQKYYAFIDNEHQYGVTDKNGEVLIRPQPLSLGGSYIGDGRFFPFFERQGDSLIRRGYLDRRGKPIFPTYFKYVTYTGYEDYFIVSKENATIYDQFLQSPMQDRLLGLGIGGTETLVLTPNFERIFYNQYTGLFILDQSVTKDKEEVVQGIFNPKTQKWLLEAKEFYIQNNLGAPLSYFVLKNIKTKKYSLIDTSGRYLITPSQSIDSIGIIDGREGQFWVKKKNKYHILEIVNGRSQIHQTAYDYLSYISFGNSLSEKLGKFVYFLAKRNGKWGVIDIDEHIVKPFDYDYAAGILNQRTYQYGFILVKNGMSYYYNISSLPNEDPEYPNRDGDDTSPKKAVYKFNTIDNTNGVFYINDTGKVVIPPQYKIVYNENGANDEFQIVEDLQKHKKIIFEETGQVLDMPLRYDIVFAKANCQVAIIKDTTEVSYGVVSSSGKELIPCINYGVAIGDLKQSVFFVKRDTPAIQRYFLTGLYLDLHTVGKDSLNIEDKNWLMFDANGKQIDANSFRFPIVFENGIGIGLQGDDFNLYRTDGSILTPFDKQNNISVERNFNNIRRIKPMNFYALYRNQGLTPTLILTKSDGHILVENGRYDGISAFNGAYALVSAAGRIGLIDTFGREIIAPQDLRTYKNALIDSLNKDKLFLYSNDDSRSETFNEDKRLPFAFLSNEFTLSTDSLKISAAQRATLLNLMLDKSLNMVVNKANNLKIPRSIWKRNAPFLFDDNTSENHTVSLQKLSISENMMSFAWSNSKKFTTDFFNFKKINERWEEKNIYDLLDLSGDKRLAINDLLTKKIKALKDQNIDCSNSSDFMAQVERRFMLTEKGIDFCFSAENHYDGDMVVIPFSWQELAPFLKK